MTDVTQTNDGFAQTDKGHFSWPPFQVEPHVAAGTLDSPLLLQRLGADPGFVSMPAISSSIWTVGSTYFSGEAWIGRSRPGMPIRDPINWPNNNYLLTNNN